MLVTCVNHEQGHHERSVRSLEFRCSDICNRESLTYTVYLSFDCQTCIITRIASSKSTCLTPTHRNVSIWKTFVRHLRFYVYRFRFLYIQILFVYI